MPRNTEKKKRELTALKGMRDLTGDDFFALQGFMEKAAEVALYYGCTPIETPILEREEVFTAGLNQTSEVVAKEMYAFRTRGGDRLALRPEGTASVMRAYLEHGMNSLPQPVMLYYGGPFFRHDNPQRGRYRQFYSFGIEIIGSPKSIMDAFAIKMTLAILAEAGIKDPTVLINSLGDKSCRESYRRELSSYYRKHAKDVCAECRERLKVNPLRLLDCKDPKCQPIKAQAPEAIAFLCSECKAHFTEVMEYLDELAIPYQLDHTLVRGLDYYTRTVFEVVAPTQSTETKEEDGEEAQPVRAPLALAGGGRYDYLARYIGGKKDIPAVGVGIGVDRVLLTASQRKLLPRIVKKPEVYFIQIGFDAKLRSLSVIEILRKARVPVLHALGKDSLSAQLATVERLGIPYCIILGQKEVIDGTVIVRNMANRSQDTIPLTALAEHLKKIKK